MGNKIGFSAWSGKNCLLQTVKVEVGFSKTNQLAEIQTIQLEKTISPPQLPTCFINSEASRRRQENSTWALPFPRFAYSTPESGA